VQSGKVRCTPVSKLSLESNLNADVRSQEPKLTSKIGLGVGDSSATPTGAMLIQVIRECMGKLATIFFAHVMGTSIEAECKAYRLASDVLCDTAIILDCLSPFFPKSVRFLVLCVSSILFSAAGVAGNASKSSLSGHFARWNNLGELNAVSFNHQCAAMNLVLLLQHWS
jgi:hypothetical protein